MTDEQGDPTGRSLTLRPKGEIVQFSGLVNRGLELSSALKRVEPGIEEGPPDPWAYLQRQAAEDLRDKDLDKRAAAAEGIIALGAELVTNTNDLFFGLRRFRVDDATVRVIGPQAGLSHLVLPLAESLNALFETQSWEAEGGWHGREYFPPDERLRNLLLGALSVCKGEFPFDRQQKSTEAVEHLISCGNVEQRFEAAVWLGKHAPKEFDEAVQREKYRDVRLFLAAALIELGDSRRSEAESVLLQVVGQMNSDAAEITRLILAKLDSPESFLQAWCRQLCQSMYYYASKARLYYGVLDHDPELLEHLILEIIRRRGPGALTALQRARAVSRIVPPRPLVEATYDALNELDGVLDPDADDFLNRGDIRRYRQAMRWLTPAEALAEAQARRKRRGDGKEVSSSGDGDEREVSSSAQASPDPELASKCLMEPGADEVEEEYEKPDLDLAWKCVMERLERILREAG